MKKLAALPFSEHAFQTMVCEYMTRAVRPELYWSAIENGGRRSMSVAVKLKRAGLKPGSPDLYIMLPEGRIAWLELKAKGGSLSIEQKAFRDVCKRLGHYWAVARTLDEVISYLAKVGATKGNIA
jgi:hypothetical protein